VPAPRPASLRALVPGVVLVLAGLVSWALYAVQARAEQHSYTAGGNPPADVRIESGHTYWLAIHGGVQRETVLGVQPSTLQCTAAAPGQGPGALELVAQQKGTKATDQIASFVASFTGTVHIECDRIGPVYVDNAADAGFDWSGAWLVLAALTLVIGIPLTLSALRRLPGRERRPEGREVPVDGEAFFAPDQV
jgi:hypothetical protein